MSGFAFTPESDSWDREYCGYCGKPIGWQVWVSLDTGEFYCSRRCRDRDEEGIAG